MSLTPEAQILIAKAQLAQTKALCAAINGAAYFIAKKEELQGASSWQEEALDEAESLLRKADEAEEKMRKYERAQR